MAQENHDWGYDRIVGALANLGYQVCDQTVGNVLRGALRDCRYLLHDREAGTPSHSERSLRRVKSNRSCCLPAART